MRACATHLFILCLLLLIGRLALSFFVHRTRLARFLLVVKQVEGLDGEMKGVNLLPLSRDVAT